MRGGFGAGFLAGTLLAVVLAVLVAIVAPLPPPDPVENAQTEFNPPAGSGFNAAGVDREPALPSQDGAAGAETAAELPAAGTAPSPAVEVDTAPADRPAQAAPTAPAPQIDEPVTAIAEPEPTPTVPPSPVAPAVPATPVQPTPEVETEPTADTPVAPPADPVAESAATTDNAEPAAPLTPPRQPALLAHAAEPDAPAGLASMAVVLIDTGLSAEALARIMALGTGVTIGIDPARPDAAASLARVRAAGLEAVVLTPADLAAETAASVMDGVLASHGEVVALLDRPSARIQSETALARVVLPRLASGGYGFVPYDIGLNTVLRAASELGIAAYPAFRDLDAGGENAATIGRYLTRAALKARQDGQVIMVGHTYPDTIEALEAFHGNSRAGEVALVPVSAILQARLP